MQKAKGWISGFLSFFIQVAGTPALTDKQVTCFEKLRPYLISKPVE